MWDLTASDPAATTVVLPSQSFVKTLAFSPGGSLLITGNQDGTARLWDLIDIETGTGIDISSDPLIFQVSPGSLRTGEVTFTCYLIKWGEVEPLLMETIYTHFVTGARVTVSCDLKPKVTEWECENNPTCVEKPGDFFIDMDNDLFSRTAPGILFDCVDLPYSNSNNIHPFAYENCGTDYDWNCDGEPAPACE